MRKNIYKKFFITIPFIFLLYAGCDALGVFAGSSSAEFSLITELGGVNTIHIPNDKFFYVNLKPGTFEGEENNRLDALIYSMDDGPGTDCKIPVEEESTEDLYCLIDIMEGDLWIHTFNLEYNVPEGMCDFLSFQVPWHFNQSVGRGPARVYQVDNFQDGPCECEGEGTERTCTVETETRYCLGNLTGNTVAGVCGAGEDEPIVTGCDTPVNEVNQYCNGLNLSNEDLGNCCFGTYRLYNTGSDVEPTTVDWGGDLNTCIGGYGKTGWSTRGKYGEPISLIRPTKRTGLIDDYEIPALVNLYNGHSDGSILKGKRPSLINANFWKEIEDKKFLEGTPRVYKPPTDPQLPATYHLVYSYQKQGYPYFTWACLNQAYEVKHRIHLALREWNTQEEFNAFVESKGGRGDPDLEGEEGSVCEYYEAGEKNLFTDTSYCNDMWDLDDLEAQPARIVVPILDSNGNPVLDVNDNPTTREEYRPYPLILYGGN